MKYLLLACIILMGCNEGLGIDHSEPSPHDPIVFPPSAQSPHVEFGNLSIEHISGQTNAHAAGDFLLACGNAVSIIQIWCSDGETWYLVTDPKITDGLVVFQCGQQGEWRAVIVN